MLMHAREGVLLLGFCVLFSTVVQASRSSNEKCTKVYLNPRNPDNFVCVCNSTLCHELPNFDPWSLRKQLIMFTTSKEGRRFEKSIWSLVSKKADDLRTQMGDVVDTELTIRRIRSESNQVRIKGFGGALTDSAAINLNALDEEVRLMLINAYFTNSGSEYSIVRFPIASCDFSTSEYSYADEEGDVRLKCFKLHEEDAWKINILKTIKKFRQKKGGMTGALYLFGSPWSAPGWMKSNGHMRGGGTLLDKYQRVYAAYIKRFIEAYSEARIDIQSVTVQNEPSTGRDPDYPYQTMYFSAKHQQDFVKNHLGPAFKEKDIELMIFDDLRYNISSFVDTVLADSEAAFYVDGIAVHWYADDDVDPAVLSEVHKNHPDKFILGSEACNTDQYKHVDYGSWERGDMYARDIIQDLRHNVSGWVDWNRALNMEGRPNWVQNFVDSPVLVNSGKQEFYLQPMYYVLAHFNKYVKKGMVMDEAKLQTRSDLEVISFRSVTEGKKTIVIRNPGSRDMEVKIMDPDCNGETVIVPIDAYSLNTLMYKCA
ncbi:hypothetical protein L596_005703 [Steinernema carpocapsae]|uniref:Glucosylceramidase n=1 Tax=Steinernema carpocapsae TaxID=34508 RepID=A0A4U8UZW3_STECR|nr:hypothetical protein L596_005703 [Steinernema carpocapsae]